MTSAARPTVTRLRQRPILLLSLVLYALGLIVLLSPVMTSFPSANEQSNGVGTYSRTCGLTLVQAFATAPPEGVNRDSALDCAATARGRVGYGFLLLLLSVPAGASALLTEVRTAGRG